MEKHIEIALANAEAALQFIDPWARVIAVQDDVRMARVLEELRAKYDVEDITLESYTKEHDIYVYAELRLDVPCEYPNDDYPERYWEMPEFSLWTPRKYNEEYYSYGINLCTHKDTIDVCRFKECSRGTPYTVEWIGSHKTTQQRAERLQRLIELDAPKIICFHEEMSLRRAEYMIDVKLNRLLQDLHEQADIDAVFVQM